MANNSKRIELQERDESVLTDCRDLTVLSLDQLRRLHWPEAGRETARKRLSVLMNHGEKWLVNLTVSKPEMKTARLEPGMVYHLSKTGQRWFRRQDRPPGRDHRRQQIIHDLLISEFYVRLVEFARQQGLEWTAEWYPDWQIRFYRHRGDDRPRLVPDGLGVLKRQGQVAFAFFLELDYSREGHGRPSSRIGRKIGGYDDFLKRWPTHEVVGELPFFPSVLLTTHGAKRRDNLARSVLRHRRRSVAYGLALTDDLLATEPNFLAAPYWLLIPADSDEIIGLNSGVLQSLAGHKGWLTSLSQNQRPTTPQSAKSGRSGAVSSGPLHQPVRPVVSSLTVRSAIKPNLDTTSRPKQKLTQSTSASAAVLRSVPNRLLLLPDSPNLRQIRYLSGLPTLPDALFVFRSTVVPKTPQAVVRYRQQKRAQ